MNIEISKNAGTTTICVNESLTSLNAKEFGAIVKENLDGVEKVIMDLSGMDYTSSAGLRVFLWTQQYVDDNNAEMTVRGVNDFVMDLFEETGFVNVLEIEE